MSLTNEEASIILGMVARGDNKHDIAAWFGVNQARVKEVEDGTYGSLTAAPPEKLLPRGQAGPKGRRLRRSVAKAIDMLASGSLDEAIKILQDAGALYDKNQS